MRKILEQRLENARNDYSYLQENSDGSDDYKLCEIIGQMEAYVDVLNLVLPAPRTEQEILKDFEALGYSIENSYNHPFVEMSKYNEEYCVYEFIAIDKSEHNYGKYVRGGDVMPITMQEHKLLNELFTLWGWL